MHERTRRQLCRLLFCLLVLAPTGWVSGTICYRASSWGAAAIRNEWEVRLTRALGLRTRIGRVFQPAPGLIVLESVAFHDPDGDQRLAVIRVLELSVGSLGWSGHALQAEIEPGQLALLLERLHDRLLRDPDPLTVGELYASEVTLRGTEQSQTLTNLWSTAQLGELGPQIAIEFQLAGIEMPSPAELRILRNRRAIPAVTSWQLRTGARPLPCSFLGDYLPGLRYLGPRAEFAGTIWAERSTANWNGEVIGTIQRLSLGDLLEPFPHKLTGTAEVELKRARVRDGKLAELSGRIRAPGGVVSRSLIRSLEEAFQVSVPALPDSDATRLMTYRELGMAFELDSTGLRLIGECGKPANAIMVLNETLQIAAPAANPLPAVGLARALLPQSEFQVPLARQTDLLLRTLPLPQALAPAEANSQSYSPLRLRR
jgi:hypothetical protein